MEHVTAAEPDLQQPTDDAPALPGLDHVPGGPTLEDRPSAVRLTKHSWTFVVRATVREFLDDDCLDNAAALTFYAVLAAFPGLVALTSLVGVLGQGGETVDVILGVLRDFRHPVGIVTKGAMVERDADILSSMAAEGLARVGISITTLDPLLARRMEPRAPAPARVGQVQEGADVELAMAGMAEQGRGDLVLLENILQSGKKLR